MWRTIIVICAHLLLIPALQAEGQEQFPHKIISYNIWNGFENDKARRARFVEWITSKNADIVVLTELVGFKNKDLATLGMECGYRYAALLKEEGYPVGVLSRQPIKVESKLTEGFWHGMLHVRTWGIDLIATHLSPFEWKFRQQEATRIVEYVKQKGMKDYVVAGDLNAHSPLDADVLDTHDSLLINMQQWDASQPKYRNLRHGRYDFSVISRFLAAGMEDAIGRLVHPAENRMSFPSAFLYGWKADDRRLPLRRERIDYILLSPSLMDRCVGAEVNRVEGVSDHYPVSVTFRNRKEFH